MPHRKRARQCALLCLLAFVRPPGIDSQTPGCTAPDAVGALEAPDDIAPPDWEGRPEYFSWGHGGTRPNLGEGYLDVTTRDPRQSADWLPAVSLPLYGRPGDDRPRAWIFRGWWIPVDRPEAGRVPLTYRGMLETGYEIANLVVLEARPDGWLALDVDLGPGPGRGVTSGTMWTRRCLLEAGPRAVLRFVPWTEVFGPDGTAYGITFRDETRHALRAAPAPEATRLAWVEPRDEIEILEFDGDWARVRTSRPGRHLTGCLGETWDGQMREGWVRWRDPDAGPLIWYPTRGC